MKFGDLELNESQTRDLGILLAHCVSKDVPYLLDEINQYLSEPLNDNDFERATLKIDVCEEVIVIKELHLDAKQ